MNEKRHEIASLANRTKGCLRRSITAKPSSHWAAELDKKIVDYSIRCWAASVIWWAYPSAKAPRLGQRLYALMDDCPLENGLFDRNDDLNMAFDLLGLPHPVSEGSMRQRMGYGSILSEADVEAIERRLNKGERQIDLANEYGITSQAITNYKRNGRIKAPMIRERVNRKAA